MLPSQRLKSLRALQTVRSDFRLCRDVEALCHSSSDTPSQYGDRIRHAVFNLKQNSKLDTNVVQEKYDSLNDRQFQAIVRCRRCGSQEVSWEEKQTRSADEGATVFCVCTTCKNRWVMR